MNNVFLYHYIHIFNGTYHDSIHYTDQPHNGDTVVHGEAAHCKGK